ncbi:MAG: FG-GAP-like repeat-containing protein, partial [Methanosarcinales archaeon]
MKNLIFVIALILLHESLLSQTFVFDPKEDFTTGGGPISILTDDLDGDGKYDLAVANQNSNTFSVLRNISTNGSISLETKVDFETGSLPRAIGTGDLDGDNKNDIAVANFSSNTISVFRNTSTSGSISFETKVDLTTETYPYGVGIGDLDGDGKLDLVTTNHGSNTISVFCNTSTTGSISFETGIVFTAGNGVISGAIEDFDGDGKPDIAVVNHDDSTLSVFPNISTVGSISLGTKIDYKTGRGPRIVAIGDLDADGKPDIAVPNSGGNSTIVSVFRNISTVGNISFESKLDFTAGGNPQSISIGDLDGDNRLDLAVADHSSSTISLLRNTSTSGTITFATREQLTANTGPYDLVVADLDGDNKLDIAIANWGREGEGNTISVFRNATPIGVLVNKYKQIPVEYFLSQNFPNPFNPITTIRYGLPKSTDVSLTVYNLLGQKVAELVNSHQEPGYYQVSWN